MMDNDVEHYLALHLKYPMMQLERICAAARGLQSDNENESEAR